MTTSEPTTGEIVRALRYCADVNSVCGDACPAHLDESGCRTALMQNAADRLESQEREIERLNEELEEMQEAATVLHAANETHWTYIKELTARAESAERERDAAIADIERMRKEKIPLCPICDFNDMIRCCHDSHCNGYQLFRWRGLPKEGDAE